MTEDRSVFAREQPGPDRTVTWGPHAEAIVDVHGDDNAPLVVALVHGGFWHPDFDRAHLRPMAAALAAAGAQAVVVEYRREHGDPDASVDDVLRGLQAASAIAGTRPLIVVGHSAGAHLALVAASRPGFPPVARIVAIAPVADLREAERLDLDDGATRRFLGAAAGTRPDLDPMRLPVPAPPVVVVHGTDDERVPAAMGRAYADRARATLVELPGTGHFEPIDPRHPIWPAVLGAIADRASAGSPGHPC